MGAYLTLVQQATWDVSAEYDYGADNLRPLASSYGDWFVERVRERLKSCRGHSATATTLEDGAWVESLINAARASLDTPFVPALVHTDYAEGNVVAKRAGEGWRIGGVFDLGDAYMGDGEYDLARLACWYGMQGEANLRAFCDAYTKQLPPRAGFPERLALYIAADRLIFWEYGHRNNVWFSDPDQTFRMWAEPYVAVADAAARG
jgi:Ser/Thr protein kinase RdoA (MazF antagonist)